MNMKAVVYTKFGAPDVLQLVDHPLPQRAAGEVLVKIMCSSVNPVDYMIRNGSIPMAKAKKVSLKSSFWPRPVNCNARQLPDKLFAYTDSWRGSRWGRRIS